MKLFLYQPLIMVTKQHVTAASLMTFLSIEQAYFVVVSAPSAVQAVRSASLRIKIEEPLSTSNIARLLSLHKICASSYCALCATLMLSFTPSLFCRLPAEGDKVMRTWSSEFL